MTETSRDWHGTPLDMGENLDHEGIQELRIEYDTGEEDIFRPRLRREFGSYELQQIAAYIDHVSSRMGGS